MKFKKETIKREDRVSINPDTNSLILFGTESEYERAKKLLESQDIISILSLVLLTTLVLFNKPTIIIYLLIEILLWIIYLLFKRSVMMKK